MDGFNSTNSSKLTPIRDGAALLSPSARWVNAPAPDSLYQGVVALVSKIEWEDAFQLVAYKIRRFGSPASRIIIVSRVERWLLSSSSTASLIISGRIRETKLLCDPRKETGHLRVGNRRFGE